MASLAQIHRDGGSELRHSLKGLAMSLPELFFVNIRKGSFPGLPEPWTPH